jgi:4-hydroxyacetophenone monooxygenase
MSATMTATIEETLKNESTNNAVTEVFIRDAIDKSTVNALRLALYQATGDATLADMKVSKEPIRGGAMLDYVLSKEDEDIVKTKALEFLLALQMKELLGTSIPGSKQPSLENASKLMGVFCGEQLKQRELQLGFEELAFQDFPRGVTWTKKPSAEKLTKYHVVIIGAGINGISIAVNLQRLGISYTLIDRQSDVGGTWLLNTYPEARVDTLGFSFSTNSSGDISGKKCFPQQTSCASI